MHSVCFIGKKETRQLYCRCLELKAMLPSQPPYSYRIRQPFSSYDNPQICIINSSFIEQHSTLDGQQQACPDNKLKARPQASPSMQMNSSVAGNCLSLPKMSKAIHAEVHQHRIKHVVNIL